MLLKPLASALLRAHQLRPLRLAPARSHWNKDYKPGPYPVSYSERVKAAAKYKLDVEDYEPHDADSYYGDYPKLPDISDASKDLFYPYDFPEVKRNFCEPLHVDKDLYGEDKYDIDQYYTLRPPFYVQLAQFVGAVLLYCGVAAFFERCKMFPGVAPKQYPHRGKSHYTFENCAPDAIGDDAQDATAK